MAPPGPRSVRKYSDEFKPRLFDSGSNRGLGQDGRRRAAEPRGLRPRFDLTCPQLNSGVR